MINLGDQMMAKLHKYSPLLNVCPSKFLLRVISHDEGAGGMIPVGQRVPSFSPWKIRE